MNKNKLLLTIFKISIAFIPIILLIIIFRNNVKSQQASLESQKVQELLEKNQNLEKELKIVREQLAEGIEEFMKKQAPPRPRSIEKTMQHITEEIIKNKVKNELEKLKEKQVRETTYQKSLKYKNTYGYSYTLTENNGKYQLTYSQPVRNTIINTTFNCIKKNLSDKEFTFKNENGLFYLPSGTSVFFIQDFYNTGANAIIITTTTASVYTNDINPNYYELFDNLVQY